MKVTWKSWDEREQVTRKALAVLCYRGRIGCRVSQGRNPGKQGGSWGCTRRSRRWSCAKGENEPVNQYCDAA